MRHPSSPQVLVLGASGRLGAMLRRYWGEGIEPRWQFRTPVDHRGAVVFDPLADSPDLEPCDVVLGLAGVVRGPDAALQNNTDLAVAAVELAAKLGARHVFVSSSAAVYGASDALLSEAGPTHPSNSYGSAKLAMEVAALSRARALAVPVTVLRIGNVAGADALLGRVGVQPLRLDRFADGHGPRRSYIGPRAFATVLAQLVQRAFAGHPIPTHLNVAMPGAVAMADLLRAGSVGFDWCTAPASAVPQVVLDVQRLAELVPLPAACPEEIVQDWQHYRQAAG